MNQFQFLKLFCGEVVFLGCRGGSTLIKVRILGDLSGSKPSWNGMARSTWYRVYQLNLFLILPGQFCFGVHQVNPFLGSPGLSVFLSTCLTFSSVDPVNLLSDWLGQPLIGLTSLTYSWVVKFKIVLSWLCQPVVGLSSTNCYLLCKVNQILGLTD